MFMNQLFILSALFVFLTILVESIHLILQLKDKKLTKWFGKNAFNIHAIITGIFWLITVYLIFLLQFELHPLFHENIFLKYFGLILLIFGSVSAFWAFKLLGWKRTLCINFFEENIPLEKTSIYKYINNPMDIGFWTAVIGYALFTASLYNLIIAIEFILVMYPHMLLENKKI